MLDVQFLIEWWKHAVRAYIAGLRRSKLHRRYKGGLWINFKNGTWVQSEWTNKEKGYIKHTQDGGVYHKSFNLINKIEDYTRGS